MKKALLVLVVAALLAPAYGEVFRASLDGCFDTYRGDFSAGNSEGYANGGLVGQSRLIKYNQEMGWFSFKNSVEVTSKQTLAAFLAANPSVQAYFYVKFNPNANNLGDATCYLVSLRSGNTGDLVEDNGPSAGAVYTAVPSGYVGGSELQAFRGCQPQTGLAFTAFGDGLYYQNSPTAVGGTQGEAWIAPSGRGHLTGMSPLQFSAGDKIQYDIGLNAGGAATNTFTGFYFDGNFGGRSIYALEDLLGFWANKTISHTVANIYSAGQIVNGGQSNPTVVSMANNAISPDPVTASGLWLGIPLDDAFLRDMVNNSQNKGFVFDNEAAGLVLAGGTNPNPGYITLDQGGNSLNPGAEAPYLLITQAAAVSCWGDVDANGIVNGDDLAIIAYAWLATPASGNWYAPADLTGDGIVNGDDLAVVAYGWLQCIPK